MKKKEKEYSIDTLEQKIDTLINLIAIGITEGKELKDQARILSRAGLKPQEIATLLNTTANSVSVTLTKYGQGKKKQTR